MALFVLEVFKRLPKNIKKLLSETFSDNSHVLSCLILEPTQVPTGLATQVEQKSTDVNAPLVVAAPGENCYVPPTDSDR